MDVVGDRDHAGRDRNGNRFRARSARGGDCGHRDRLSRVFHRALRLFPQTR